MQATGGTVRFSVVVQRCGKPAPVTLWVDPGEDPAFQRALKQNRVATVKQETVGGKKDFAVVGFHQEPNVFYWVFEKSLEEFEGKKIIGIKYEMLREPEPGPALAWKPKSARTGKGSRSTRPSAPASSPTPWPPIRVMPSPKAVRAERQEQPVPAPPPLKPKPTSPKPAEPVLTKYRVTLRCVVELTVERELAAANKREARDKALWTVQTELVDATGAKKTWKVVRTEELKETGD
jgi:hypothetical protein